MNQTDRLSYLINKVRKLINLGKLKMKKFVERIFQLG